MLEIAHFPVILQCTKIKEQRMQENNFCNIKYCNLKMLAHKNQGLYDLIACTEISNYFVHHLARMLSPHLNRGLISTYVTGCAAGKGTELSAPASHSASANSWCTWLAAQATLRFVFKVQSRRKKSFKTGTL